jgi:hypothetical protein
VSIQKGTEAAQAYKQIPDPAIQRPWSAALAQLARASNDCIDGIDTIDSTLLDKSASELTAATGDLQKANAAVAKYTS